MTYHKPSPVEFMRGKLPGLYEQLRCAGIAGSSDLVTRLEKEIKEIYAYLDKVKG